jgi:hypothetical protein
LDGGGLRLEEAVAAVLAQAGAHVQVLAGLATNWKINRKNADY